MTGSALAMSLSMVSRVPSRLARPSWRTSSAVDRNCTFMPGRPRSCPARWPGGSCRVRSCAWNTRSWALSAKSRESSSRLVYPSGSFTFVKTVAVQRLDDGEFGAAQEPGVLRAASRLASSEPRSRSTACGCLGVARAGGSSMVVLEMDRPRALSRRPWVPRSSGSCLLLPGEG